MGKPGRERELTPADVEDALEERDRREYPVMTVSDVRDEVTPDVTKRTVSDRLRESDRTQRHKAGRSYVYWLKGDFDDLAPDDGDDSSQVTADGGASALDADEMEALLDSRVSRLQENLEEDLRRWHQSTETVAEDARKRAERAQERAAEAEEEKAIAESRVDEATALKEVSEDRNQWFGLSLLLAVSAFVGFVSAGAGAPRTVTAVAGFVTIGAIFLWGVKAYQFIREDTTFLDDFVTETDR